MFCLIVRLANLSNDCSRFGFTRFFQWWFETFTWIHRFTNIDSNIFESSFSIPRKIFILIVFQDTAKAFLRDFNPDDVVCVNFFATSVDLWQISQPIRDSVIQSLNSTDDVPVRFSYTITRNPPDDDTSGDTAAVVTGERIVNITGNDNATRQALIRMLQEDIYNPDYV